MGKVWIYAIEAGFAGNVALVPALLNWRLVVDYELDQLPVGILSTQRSVANI